MCNFILNRENVGQIAVVAVGPDVIPRFSLDELGSNADPIGGLAEAAFEHITHAEISADLLHIDRLAFIGKRRVPGDDEQRGIMRKSGDDVFGYTIGDELLLGVATHIGEGQYASEGLSGNESFGRAKLVASAETMPGRTRYTRSGRAMFWTRCSPASSKAKSSLSRTWSRTTRLTQIPPGAARASSRAATLTPSPWISRPSLIMSPRLIPIRKSMRRSGGTPAFRSAISRCTSTAHRTPSTTLADSSSTPAPGVLTRRPR